MTTRRAFALPDALAIAILAALAVTLLAGGPAISAVQEDQRRLKDATNIRSILQSLVVFASNNRDTYPRPSRIDAAGNTIKTDEPWRKDTSGNILSVLVFDGFLPPEILISPAETNPAISEQDNYTYHEPEAATKLGGDKQRAIWDPSFIAAPGRYDEAVHAPAEKPAEPGIASKGFLSYAHTPPFGNYRPLWRGTFSATEAALGNRGPRFRAMRSADGAPRQWALEDGPLGTGSKTLGFHGPADEWHGMIGYNDAHVSFADTPAPVTTVIDATTPRAGDPLQIPDNIFVSERSDGSAPAGKPARDLSMTDADGTTPIEHAIANTLLVMYNGVEARPIEAPAEPEAPEDDAPRAPAPPKLDYSLSKYLFED